MTTLQALRQLNEDTMALNERLKAIVAQIDDNHSSLSGMRDVSLRIRKAFELYASLVSELKTHS